MRRNAPRLLERRDHECPRFRVQFIPQNTRCAQYPMRQKRRIDQRLAIQREIQSVRRVWITRRPQRSPRQRRDLVALRRLVCAQIRRFQPGRDPGQRPPEGFQVRDVRAFR